MAFKRNIIFIICLITAVILIAVGACFTYIIKASMKKEVNKRVILQNGSDTFDNWVSPTIPVYMKFTMFNITNTEDVITNMSKPILVEMGPYVYREIRDKVNVSFLDHNKKISYIQPKSYVFEPTLSSGSQNDSVMALNLFAVGAAHKIYNMIENLHTYDKIKDMLMFTVRNFFINFKEDIFQSHTVYELLWGYEEPTLLTLNKLLKRIGMKPINPMVGLFSGATRNGTDDGFYTVYSGVGDVKKVNKMDTWNGETHLDFWTTKYGNMLNGTDGSQWAPFVEKQDTLDIFSSDICRSISLKKESTQKLKGIEMYRFSPPRTVLESGDSNPDNMCFCNGKCLKDGTMDVSVCREGAPIAMSMPHFYMGSKDYVDAMVGLKPNKKQHETRLDVEPITGIPMKVAKRLQINMRLNPLPTHSQMHIFGNDTVFPVLWLEESAELDDKTASDFHKQVGGPLRTGHIIQYCLIALGLAILLGCVVFAIVKFRQSKSERGDFLLPQDAEEHDATT